MCIKTVRLQAGTALLELIGVDLLFVLTVPGVAADMEMNVYEIFCVHVPGSEIFCCCLFFFFLKVKAAVTFTVDLIKTLNPVNGGYIAGHSYIT